MSALSLLRRSCTPNTKAAQAEPDTPASDEVSYTHRLEEWLEAEVMSPLAEPVSISRTACGSMVVVAKFATTLDFPAVKRQLAAANAAVVPSGHSQVCITFRTDPSPHIPAPEPRFTHTRDYFSAVTQEFDAIPM